MGPVRRGLIPLILFASPTRAFAEVCDKVAPGWDGTQVNAFQEMISLFLSPISLVLLALTLISLRFRSQWSGLVTVVFWSGFVTLITMADPTGLRVPAHAEGCVGSPALFIALVAAICIGTVLYTAPIKAPSDGDT